jgi:hypothetical protein
VSFYAMVVVIETTDANDAHAAVSTRCGADDDSRWLALISEAWEVKPDNDLSAEQEAGKWIAAGEASDYYPVAPPEFSIDGALDQRP